MGIATHADAALPAAGLKTSARRSRRPPMAPEPSSRDAAQVTPDNSATATLAPVFRASSRKRPFALEPVTSDDDRRVCQESLFVPDCQVAATVKCIAACMVTLRSYLHGVVFVRVLMPRSRLPACEYTANDS